MAAPCAAPPPAHSWSFPELEVLQTTVRCACLRTLPSGQLWRVCCLVRRIIRCRAKLMSSMSATSQSLTDASLRCARLGPDTRVRVSATVRKLQRPT